jgi:CheY-like chemotaxis protein
VQDSVETIDGTEIDPLQFMLDQGLNTQFLAMEGTRILDEKRHAEETGAVGVDSADDSEDFDFDLVDVAETQTALRHAVLRPVVIVDDDGPTLRAIADGLSARGYVVHAMTRSEETLIKVDTLHRSGERPAVLIDLIMPKMDGSGLLGGLELLELLHANFKDIQLIIMSDHQYADAEKRILELGCPFIIKPRRSEISTAAIMESFLSALRSTICNPSSDALTLVEWQNRFNLGDELRIEMGEDDDMPHNGDDSSHQGEFSLLRGMLEELNNPELQGEVLLLVLRFASEFVNRAIIFTLKDRIISGVGQFGISGNGSDSGDERVRAIHIPEESGSMLTEPFKTGRSATFSPALTPVNIHLFTQFGGGTPAEVYVGSLISQSRVIGFLYGDNLPAQKPIGDIEPLAIFLSQAGEAIEKSLLKRQLHERGTP